MHLEMIQPPKRTARARGFARRVQEGKCLLFSLHNQLDSEGTAYANRPQQPQVADKSAHQPALPEVKGLVMVVSLVTADRVGFVRVL